MRIYHPSTTQPNTTLTLSKAAAKHVSRVLRMHVGDQLTLFDGSGHEFTAHITTLDRQTVTVDVGHGQDISRESPLQIHLIQGLCRGEKMDWVIQKSVELGVASITPLHTQFSNVKLSHDRIPQKMSHWQQIMISACEQCGRNIIPTLHAPLTLSQLCAATP